VDAAVAAAATNVAAHLWFPRRCDDDTADENRRRQLGQA
jgi:hypothetical protein